MKAECLHCSLVWASGSHLWSSYTILSHQYSETIRCPHLGDRILWWPTPTTGVHGLCSIMWDLFQKAECFMVLMLWRMRWLHFCQGKHATVTLEDTNYSVLAISACPIATVSINSRQKMYSDKNSTYPVIASSHCTDFSPALVSHSPCVNFIVYAHENSVRLYKICSIQQAEKQSIPWCFWAPQCTDWESLHKILRAQSWSVR